jgi:hypothetical protein
VQTALGGTRDQARLVLCFPTFDTTEEAMTTKPVSPKFVDLENVKESLATGLTVVHPYAPGLLQIIFTTPRHDPQAVADRRFSEAVSFAVVARIIIPTSEVAGLTELLNRQAAAEREHARMANPPGGAVTPPDKSN